MPFKEPGTDELIARVELGLSSRAADAAQADAIVLTLGTPALCHIEIDIRDIRTVLDDLLPHLREDHLLVLRSTVAPGTTEFVAGYLEKQRGFRVGEDIFVAHVPERIAADRFMEEIGTLPCIIGGVGEASRRARGAPVRAARRAAGADHAGPGRAGEDLDQHPALRDVRAPEPADDGLRAPRRERVRRHRAHQPRLSARRDGAAGADRRHVPAQGLRVLRGALQRPRHAARRLARARDRAAVPGRRDQAPAQRQRPARAQDRRARPGVQGRHRRRARLALAQADPAARARAGRRRRCTTRWWPRPPPPSTMP